LSCDMNSILRALTHCPSLNRERGDQRAGECTVKDL